MKGTRSGQVALRALLLVVVTGGCASPTPPPLERMPVQPGLANPASRNCIDQGGALSLHKNGGGSYGVCTFPDNRQCEEWAMLRGECPVGGLRVTGYVTAAARYCAITGGQYAVTSESNTPSERGTCAFPGGKTCDARAWYEGECRRR
jgi:hypothetical protein